MRFNNNKNSARGAVILTLAAILVACGGRVKEEDINNYSVVSSDDGKDAGGGATQGAVAERMTFATDERQEREPNKQQERVPNNQEQFPTEPNPVPSPQNLTTAWMPEVGQRTTPGMEELGPRREQRPREQLPSRREVLGALNAQHREWRRVRYQIGGMSKDGIDCSRFVFVTFQKHFNLDLPKNTEAQLAAGLAITRRDLEAGDLVFFKTGWKTNHVGIYLKDGVFLHASATRGVTLSRLDNRYWARRYWRSLRVLRSTEQLSDSHYRDRPDSFHRR